LQFFDVTKVFLGFSVYPQVSAGAYTQKLFKTGLELKKKLKVQGISCRLVTSRETNLSAVVVAHNKLLTAQGREFVILKNNNQFFIGETIDVQPFAELSKRDYGRPQRDSQSGMIPPKLALMMLNLSMAKDTENILDPFCGSGTILQEAVWQGRTNLYGSDISARDSRYKTEFILAGKRVCFTFTYFTTIASRCGYTHRVTFAKNYCHSY